MTWASSDVNSPPMPYRSIISMVSSRLSRPSIRELTSALMPAWLIVCDAEGMSVLTAWAAGQFDAERIAKAIKGFNVADKVSVKRVVLPGHVAVLSGELEEELSGWDIRVGPREAVDLPKYMKEALK